MRLLSRCENQLSIYFYEFSQNFPLRVMYSMWAGLLFNYVEAHLSEQQVFSKKLNAVVQKTLVNFARDI